MSQAWLEQGLNDQMHDEEEYGLMRCARCKRRMEYFDDDPQGFTNKGRRKYEFCEGRRPQRCAACGFTAQEQNNARLQEEKPPPAKDRCIICNEPLVHPGRKGVRKEDVNITASQWRKGNADRRCKTCAADHKNYHAELRDLACSGTGGTA